MTITVGTNTYLSVADADAYWTARNDSVWSASTVTTAQKEKALLEATQFLDANYQFIGDLANMLQPLAWPRSNAVICGGNFDGQYYSATEYPQKLKDATAELALEALSARLAPTETRGGAVKKEKVDVIEVEYFQFAPSGKTYRFVSMLLNPLVVGSSGSIRLERD